MYGGHMKQITIVYFSGSGSTRLMAQSVLEGVNSVEDIQASVIALEGRDIIEGRYKNESVHATLAGSDAIIFGTPTYMGGPSAQFKAFADSSAGIWFRQGWKDKVAGGFTISGSPSGDKLLTLEYLSIFAAQHGMIWITSDVFPSHYLGKTDGHNRLGASVGVMGHNETPQGQEPQLHSGDAATARAYGKRIAQFTLKIRS